MGKQSKEQTTPSEQWIDGVPPWTRMERFVRNYNRLPDESMGRDNGDDEEGEIVLDF